MMKRFSLRGIRGVSLQYLLMAALLCGIVVCSCGEKQVELSPEVKAIMSYSFGQSREPLTVVSDMVVASQGDAEKREYIERQFAQVLRAPGATYECKDFICRQLWFMGTDISVPALRDMLTDATYSDMARYALEQNASPNAEKAFRDTLGKASGAPLIGIINSIGRRGDEKSVPALEKIAAGVDKEAADAAKSALDKIKGM